MEINKYDYKMSKYSKILLTASIGLFIILLFFYLTIPSFKIEGQTIDDNNNEFNVIAVGDVGCSTRAQENIKDIEKLDPELFLVAGDLSYAKTPDCWFDMTKSLDSKTKIAIGNHDDYEEEGTVGERLKKAYMDHYNLNKSYYSFDYKNIHILVLDSQLELSVDTLESSAIPSEPINIKDKKEDGKTKKENENIKQDPIIERYPAISIREFLKKNSINFDIPALDKLVETNSKVPNLPVDQEQYQFAQNDLEKNSQNKNIDWIFVMIHKTMYYSMYKQWEEYIMRNKYQPLFDKYHVDLVLQGHNHIYSRTFPLSFNIKDISQPIIDKSSSGNNNTFANPNGTIFLVVGTGGADPFRLLEKPYYVANHYNNGFGFVELKIDGKRLDAIFYDINLKCQLKTTKKKESDVVVHKSCLPPTPSNDKLKVIDYFTITK